MENGEILSGKQGKTKKVYYEWIRLIACFFVIFNHLKGYVLFMNASGIKQAFYMVLSAITKINVPLFFMVSGALLLEKQENIVTVLKKRI
ncbi:MAG: acyltransferase, partial [Lachnospiraceae bacterium]|nr:acyltransferase [Lachnospiraceae bacterium]